MMTTAASPCCTMGPDQIEEEFQERINLLQEAHLDTDWKLVHEETEDWPNQTKNPGPAASPQILDAEAFNGVLDMKIYRYIGQNAKTDMRFKLVMDLPAGLDEAWEFLTDIQKRPSWDDMMVEAKILQQLGPQTRIQYTRSKGIFPVSSRETVAMFRTIENGLKPAGRRMGIAFSVDDYFHVPVHSNCVRAFAHFVGSMFDPRPDQPHLTRVTQVLEVDPKGWISSGFIKLMTAIQVPSSIKKMRRIVASLSPPANTTKTFEKNSETSATSTT